MTRLENFRRILYEEKSYCLFFCSFHLIYRSRLRFVRRGRRRKRREIRGFGIPGLARQFKIKNKVLSWDAVENASKYEVYVNGKRKRPFPKHRMTVPKRRFSDLLRYRRRSRLFQFRKKSNDRVSCRYRDGRGGYFGPPKNWNGTSTRISPVSCQARRHRRKFALEAAAIDALTTALENDEQIENADDLKNCWMSSWMRTLTLEPYVSAILLALRPSLEDSYDRATSPQEKEMLGEILGLRRGI